MESYLITMGISVILQTLKNETAKRKFRSAFLKVYRAIGAAFAADEEFKL